MAPSRARKGKTRVSPTPHEEEAPPSPPASVFPALARKPRRAETRPCPVCDEAIPVRLLAQHAELELSRIDAVVDQIGSPQPLLDQSSSLEAGPSSGVSTRRSALKARRAINPRSIWATDATAWLSQTNKSLRALERRRKARHVALRDAPVDDAPVRRWQICPVCATSLPGEQDAVDAHIDSCLAHAAMAAEDAVARAELGTPEDDSEDGWQEVEVDGAVRLRPSGRALQASGIHVRTSDQDVDEEVDVDGDDADAFGVAQFTERDVVPLGNMGQATETDADIDVEVDVDGDGDDANVLQELADTRNLLSHEQAEDDVAAGSQGSSEKAIDAMELHEANATVDAARRSGNRAALIQALEGKIHTLESKQATSPTHIQCRICLDAYIEPTVSTGCWHTCCRACWLRCLGATKLCPMCKRITTASELRRVYL